MIRIDKKRAGIRTTRRTGRLSLPGARKAKVRIAIKQKPIKYKKYLTIFIIQLSSRTLSLLIG